LLYAVGLTERMKLAFVTTYDATNVAHWSGLGTHISRAIQDQGIDLRHVGPIDYNFSFLSRAKYKFYQKILNRVCLPEREHFLAAHYARKVNDLLQGQDVDIVFSPGSIPVSKLQCDAPIVIYADATFAGLIELYYQYVSIDRDYLDKGHALEKEALDKCALAIFASDWAAETATKFYGTSPSKIRVIPFGANLQKQRSETEILSAIERRPIDLCRLLFVGVDWERKGGDIAVAVADKLNERGIKTELTVVGCLPPKTRVNDHIKIQGFISKQSKDGRERLDQLYLENHFLILPTRAECFGVVFCEASSFGVPSISCATGGVPTAVRNGRNGQLFALDAEVDQYVEYIANLWEDYDQYKSLAASSLAEYQERLNWGVAGLRIRNQLEALL